MGTNGPVIAKVQNKTTETHSKIIPCTTEWDSMRTQIFLLSLNISGILSAAHVMQMPLSGGNNWIYGADIQQDETIPATKPDDADITSVASIDIPRYRQECGDEKQDRCW